MSDRTSVVITATGCLDLQPTTQQSKNLPQYHLPPHQEARAFPHFTPLQGLKYQAHTQKQKRQKTTTVVVPPAQQGTRNNSTATD